MTTVADAFVSLRLSPAAATELKAQTTAALESGGRAGGARGGAVAGSGFLSAFRKETSRGMPGAGQSVASQIGATLGKATKVGALGLIALGGASLAMAANFQAGLTTLVTGAGESEKNLGKVGEGIKSIAADSGTATKQLVDGMYMIESAGFHGAAGLAVLKAAAEGAKLSNADLGTVANAVTTVMKDYGLGGDQATAATNALIATVSRGKVHLGDLSTSLARVLPTAAALKIPLGQVGGAMATLTGEGTSARFAAMGLNAAILAMAAPSGIAAKTMKTLGGSSAEVASTLQKHGLIAALQMVSDLAERAGKKGSPEYVAAMKAMLGGTQGLRVGLQLTGGHMRDLQSNTAAVSGAFVRGGQNVTGWALAQKDARVQFDKFKSTIEVLVISIGQHLLPIASSVLTWLNKSHLAIPLVIAAVAALTIAFIAQAIAIQATPIGWIADGIIALIAVMYLLRNKWGTIWQAIRNATAWVVDKILGLFGFIIHAAASAFGWIPGIGPKLKDAAAAFDRFRQRVNDAIRGIHDKTVSVKVRMAAVAAGTKSGKFGANPQFAAAAGLYIRDGQPGVDDQLIMAQRGELVVPRWAVAAGYVDHLRGMIPGFAAGGPVGVAVAGSFPPARRITRVVDQTVAALVAAQAASIAALLGALGGGGYGASALAAQRFARGLFWLFGWGAAQWPPLLSLWTGESGWRWNARNPGSGAYGIPQALPASKMASAGADWLTNYRTQVLWGERYIRDVYGTPARAYALWLSRSPHWYGRGGTVTEPILGLGLQTGRAYGFGETGREEVTSQAGLALLAGLLADLIKAVNQSATTTGQAVGQALGHAARLSAHQAAYSPAWR